MKIITFYLPQFHCTPENDEWWGKEFTEWINMKKSKSLFNRHYQPRVPLNNNYYDLSDPETMRWQIELAKKYGVYGWCIYHYWFNGKLLLEKPVENLLKDKTMDIHFCLSWANEPWTNAWVAEKPTVLIAQRYGREKEWKEHFDYLLPYFLDERYIKVDGKPLFVLYKTDIIPDMNEMLDYYQDLAREAGLPGICFAYQALYQNQLTMPDDSRFDLNIHYEPPYAVRDLTYKKHSTLRRIKRKIECYLNMHTNINIERVSMNTGLKFFDYDEVWGTILKRKPVSEKCVPGAYVDWDNTPRRPTRGSIHQGASPEKFRKYLSKQIKRAKSVYHKDMIFMFAWNEWAEGGYVEPDEKFKYGYLEAIKTALEENGEFPE